MDRVRANGVDYAYLAEGDGPLVLLFHGFPDTAHTWDDVRPALAKAGYRAVSPFLRGYHPTGPAPDGRYGGEPLGEDIVALIEALGEERAVVVGHDWGALGAYTAAGLAEERVRMLVTLAIPHPLSIPRSLGVLWRGRHFLRFKLPGARAALEKNDFALVDALLHRWSSAWDVPPDESRPTKACFSHPESAEAAIAYYRQTGPRLPPALRKKISVPTVCFAGETDGVLLDLSVYDRARSRFTGAYEVVRMPGGHFLHREHPERFIAALLDALARHAPAK
jgi:pimeloyl-ACP methyl ester carboxylesterase